MKRKLFLFAVLFCFGIALNAQNTFNKSDLVFNGSIGIGNYSGYSLGWPIAISGEYGIIDNLFDAKSSIGVGAYMGFASFKNTKNWADGDIYTYKLTQFCLGGRGVFHYQLVDNLDTYGGLMLGLYINSLKVDYNYKYQYYDHYDYESKTTDAELAYSFFVGARYYFTDNFAVMSELGYGLTFFSLGISYKL